MPISKRSFMDMRSCKSLSAAMKWRRESASFRLLVSAYVLEMRPRPQFGHWDKRSLKSASRAKYRAPHSHSYSTARISPGEMKVRCSSVIVARDYIPMAGQCLEREATQA
jgi:hypothetical protein